MRNHIPFFVTFAALSMSCANAQETDANNARQVYQPLDFSRFAPRTALDMVRQVPGFPLEEGGNDRGFGQADTNVLINGRRISGKSNGPVEALSRIPVDDVVRLEVLDGASLDIGGLSGQVLNIVTAADGGISGQYRYSPQGRTDDVPFRWGNVSVAVSGGSDGTEWTFSVENDQNFFGSAGPERVAGGDGVLLDPRNESVEEGFDLPGLAGSLTHVSDNGSVLNLTGEVNWFIFDFEEISERNPVGDVANVRDLEQTEDEFNFEIPFTNQI